MIDKVETSVITRQIRSAQQRVEPRIVFDTLLDMLRVTADIARIKQGYALDRIFGSQASTAGSAVSPGSQVDSTPASQFSPVSPQYSPASLERGFVAPLDTFIENIIRQRIACRMRLSMSQNAGGQRQAGKLPPRRNANTVKISGSK